MCFAPQRRALFQHPNLQKWREHVVFCTFWLGNVLRATTACTFSTSQMPKVVRTCCALHILSSKFCFTPQRRALFRHLNFQNWSDHGVLCTFWLGNVLRATTACTFSTSQLPKVVRSWCVLYILTWKSASRHNGVQLFISHLASWLRTRRFSEPTFRPSGAPNHWKNTVFRDFPTFSRISIFFLLTLSLLLFFLLIFLFSLPLPCSAFHLSILSEVWLLNFLRLYLHFILRKYVFRRATHFINAWRCISFMKWPARGRYPSSKGDKNTRSSDHFWRFRCRKSACRCGAKHISKSKCSKH